MIPFGTQYYRSPFPKQDEWEDDFRMIRDSGLNTVKIWTIWGYLEPEPGRFDFGEIDEMFELAAKYGLKVCPNVLVEAQPFWVPRLHPGTSMVNHEGRVTEYGLRVESFVGVSPGGCFDHAEIQQLQERFMEALAQRYSGHESLLAWDAWNEMKWTDGALGLLCYCPATIERFRSWLKEKYGSLEELGRRWNRRYCDWQDVHPPMAPWTGFIDMLDWRRFTADGMVARARSRYESLRRGDPHHPIMVHTGGPCVGYPTQSFFQGIDDWKLTDAMDFNGTAYYPKIFIQDPTPCKCSLLLDSIRSASREKRYWISEMQGGQANRGLDRFDISPQEQRFDILNAMAKGSTGFLYWQWKHERQGIETSGFGMAEFGKETPHTRMAAEMGAFMKRNEDLLEGLEVPPSEVAILYSPDCYILNFAAEGKIPSFRGGSGKNADLCFRSLYGYYRALWEEHIVCDFLHSDKVPEMIGNYKVVILPYAFYLKRETADAIARFVENGGTVISDPFLARMDEDCVSCPVTPGLGLDQVFGVEEILVRRQDDDLVVEVDNGLKGAFYRNDLEPRNGARPIAAYPGGGHAVVENHYGKGRTLYAGTLLGPDFLQTGDGTLRTFLSAALKASGALPLCAAGLPPHCEIRHLQSTGRRLLFLINHGDDLESAVELRTGLDVLELVDLEDGTAPAFRCADGTLRLPALRVPGHSVRMLVATGTECPST